MSKDIKVISSFPRKVKEIENLFIPLSDGTKLAARLWLPVDAEKNPVPALLEFLPYRKRDGTIVRDQLTHPYFAGHGYASVRVDMRGNGDSGGLMDDEYTRQEQEDALEVIAWLSRQKWCSGNVGMFGISWGGFNALQVAALRPPALKAIVSLCSTDVDGNPVFLASNKYNLQITQERWTKVGFHTTREHGQRVSHG